MTREDEDRYSIVPERYRSYGAYTEHYDDKPAVTKRTSFLKDTRVFYDTQTKQTFAVTRGDYIKCKRQYENDKAVAEVYARKGFVYNPEFILNGHRQWIWKEDEDYSEEALKKVGFLTG